MDIPGLWAALRGYLLVVPVGLVVQFGHYVFGAHELACAACPVAAAVITLAFCVRLGWWRP